MWVTLFAALMAASVCLGMINFSVQTQREQEVLNAIPDRAAMLSIEHPTTPEMGHPG